MNKQDFEKIASLMTGLEELELENVNIETEELVFNVAKALSIPMAKVPEMPLVKEPIKFEPPIKQYKGEVAEIQLGATKKDGGSRGKVVKIGGQKTLYLFEGGIKNRPVITFDIFDMAISLPKVLREEWQDVWDSPGEWAKKAVKYGGDLVTIHLVSTDPKIKDTKPRDAAKTVEEVLQAVKVPLVIGGSGNPEKDPLVLEKAAEAAEGEMCLLASANLDLDHKKIVDAAVKYNHNVLSWVSLDINDQHTLNRLLMDEGLPKEQMVLDPTTAALGYGLEYTYTMIERIKQSALKGDGDLQMPISCGVTNAWGARESWMNVEEWGPREHRGPLWETVNAIAVLMAGVDMMMMLSPKAMKIVREVIDSMYNGKNGKNIVYEDWIKS